MPIWGTVPDWVGALGTSGALFLGFLILRREGQDKQRAHARQVSFWLEATNPGGRRFNIVNHSDRYISSVVLRVSVWPGAEGLANSPNYMERMGSLEPRARAVRRLEPSVTSQLPKGELRFTDAEGLRWNLDLNGKLERHLGDF